MHVTSIPSVIFVFPGHGSQWFGMGTRLMKTEPVYLATVKRFDEHFQSLAGWSLIDFLELEEREVRWDDLVYVQPALVAIEIALAQVWLSRGIKPDAVIGQSLGEIAAACVAGVLSEVDTARVILESSYALQRGKEGGMLLVGLGAKEAEDLAALHPGKVIVSGYLSPNFSVLSGDIQSLTTVSRELRDKGVLSQRINIPAAAHCPYTEPGTLGLEEAIETIGTHPESIPFYSTVTGNRQSGRELGIGHWSNLVTKPMLFHSTLDKILNSGPSVVIEVSPHAILTGMIEDLIESLPSANKHSVFITQRQNEDPSKTIQATYKRLLSLRPTKDTGFENTGRVSTIGKALPRVLGKGSEEINDAYAIVGMSCRLPGGVNDVDTFWEMLRSGREVIDDVPEDRWDVDAFYDPDIERANKTNKMYTRRAGFIKGIYHFDASFFQISPREAHGMDPQHRLLLETSWEALEHAGIAPSSLEGSRTGVYTGVASNFHEMLLMGAEDSGLLNPYSVVGSTTSAASGRIAYSLGLSGPAISIDTACSSSLTALQLACQGLGLKETDMALVGGVNAILSPTGIIARCQSRMMSPVGRCHSFDAAADGYVPSEGCGVVVVKKTFRCSTRRGPHSCCDSQYCYKSGWTKPWRHDGTQQGGTRSRYK